MTGRGTVPYDPAGTTEAGLPFDRAPYEALVTAVLAWKTPDLARCDYEQIALQLTGHARAVAVDVQRRAARLAHHNGRRALAEVVLGEAERRLRVVAQGTAACVQDRAQLVRALYERLDRLTETSPASVR
jgi:hypothetical protein